MSEKKKLRVDKLEERVAPAMMGGLVPDADIIEGEEIVEDDGVVQDPVDGEDDIEGEAPEGEGNAPDYYGDGAVMGDDGSITFSAPEGYDFDEYGMLDIDADAAGDSFAAYPPGTSFDPDMGLMLDDEPYSGEPVEGFFPPGSSITADGSFHYEAPEPYELNGDGTITVFEEGAPEGEEPTTFQAGQAPEAEAPEGEEPTMFQAGQAPEAEAPEGEEPTMFQAGQAPEAEAPEGEEPTTFQAGQAPEAEAPEGEEPTTFQAG